MKTRNSARAVIINDQDEVLLFKFDFKELKDSFNPINHAIWITPGGKLEDNEDFAQALKREVQEEVGLDINDIGPWVWTRNALLESKQGEIFTSHERYYLIKINNHQPNIQNMTDTEKLTLKGYKWWSLKQIPLIQSDIRPPELPGLIKEILSGNIPQKPLEIA